MCGLTYWNFSNFLIEKTVTPVISVKSEIEKRLDLSTFGNVLNFILINLLDNHNYSFPFRFDVQFRTNGLTQQHQD